MLDTVQDFNAAEDSLEISDLLDVPDNTNTDDYNAVAVFLNENVSVSKDGNGVGHVKIDGKDIVKFGSDSSLDSNGDGSINSDDSLKVIFNNQEFTINVDG